MYTPSFPRVLSLPIQTLNRIIYPAQCSRLHTIRQQPLNFTKKISSVVIFSSELYLVSPKRA